MSELFLGDAEQQAGLPPSRRALRQDRRHREQKHRRRRTAVVLSVALLLVAGAGFVVWSVVGGAFGGGSGATAVHDYPGPGSGEAQVVVASGDTGAAIAETLAHAGVVATSGAFVDAYSANPTAAQSIQPGTYRLALQMRASDALDALLDPSRRVTYRVTIPEGATAAQVYERVYERTTIPLADLTAAAADPAAIGLPAEANGSVEGWLFPATYDVEPGASAASVLAQMTAKTVAVLQARGVPKDRWADVLVRASLLEREGRSAQDRAKIAQAIQNRLDAGMILQIDASLAYGLGKPGTELTAADKDADTPYNLEKNVGLPPTPIANPGEVSIDAVLHPTPGPWKYWVTVNPDTGETKFAETYPEHQANVAELRQWQAEHP